MGGTHRIDPDGRDRSSYKPFNITGLHKPETAGNSCFHSGVLSCV